MKRLSDDFKINVLLPGAVWLLISVLAGFAITAKLETDTVTVILFAVIALVVFIVPMAVYMEYRDRIMEWPERKKKGTGTASGIPPVSENSRNKTTAMTMPVDGTIVPVSLPPGSPDALRGEKAVALLDAFAQGKILE